MPDNPILDFSVPPDPPKPPVLDPSLLPDKPDPALLISADPLDRDGPEASATPAAYLQQAHQGERSAYRNLNPENNQPLPVGNAPSDAVIRAPHADDDFYKDLLENATSDEEVMAAVLSKPLVGAMKRLYSPDTTSPKALAAAQNAIAIYQTTGISPVLTLDNPDAVNQTLFGTGHAREEFLMNTIGMFGLGAFAEAGSTLAALPGLTRYVQAAEAAGEAWKLREVEGALLPATESIYKGWALPLGIAGFTAEENANALIRSYVEGKPFSQTRPYGLHDILPEQTSDGTKTVVDLLDMFGKFKAMHAGFNGLESLWDAMAYDKISKIVPSQKLYIPAEAIRDHFGASTEGSAGEYYDILQNLQKEGMLSNGQIKDAINFGLDVEVPLSRVVGSMDAPWFAKIKNFLRISPYEDLQQFPAGAPEARLHVSGELEAPKELEKEIASSSEAYMAPSSEGASPDAAAPSQLGKPPVPPLESEAPSLSVQAPTFKNNLMIPDVVPRRMGSLSGQAPTFKNSDDYLRGLGFDKGQTPRGKDYDALVPFIDAASGKYGVPPDIVKAVVWKESNYDPDIVYGKGASTVREAGAMRLIPETAREMGVSNVFDPAQNIEGGTRYLRALYDKFGDWGKAVAAFNSDEAGKFFADNPGAKIEDAPNYSAYVRPVLDAAEKFAAGEPEPGIIRTGASGRKAGAAPKDRSPMVGARRGGYVKLTETPEFKKWFGDSKVVFKKGQLDYFQNPEGVPGIPRMVYYGTDTRHSLDPFDPGERGAILFTNSRELLEIEGKEAEIIPAYLKIENPLEIKSTGAISVDAAIDKARAQGNDGVIFDRGNGSYTYAVLSPDQVKPLSNAGTFSTSEAGILRAPDRPYVEGSKRGGKGPESRSRQEEQPGSIVPATPISRRTGARKRAESEFAAAERDNTITKLFLEIEKKPVQVIGLPAETYEDFALIAQYWRNPNYEEFRYVFFRNNIIVDHEGVTCMHPNYAPSYLDDFDRYINYIQGRIRVLRATLVYLCHNHPVGKARPSPRDISGTIDMAKLIPQMEGHIIINSGEYAYINREGKEKVRRLPNLPKDWVDPILQPTVPHELLGKDARFIDQIAGWAKALVRDRDMPVFIYVGSDMKVRGLQEIHPKNFTNVQLMFDRMPQKLVDFGSSGAVAVLPEKFTGEMLDAARHYVQAHVLWDAVGFQNGMPFAFSGETLDLKSRDYLGGKLRDAMPSHYIR